MTAWLLVRIFLPPAFLLLLQTSHLQNAAGTPSDAAVPRYLIFIVFSSLSKRFCLRRRRGASRSPSVPESSLIISFFRKKCKRPFFIEISGVLCIMEEQQKHGY